MASDKRIDVPYVMNTYRSKKINNKYIITTNHGSFMVLDEKEYKALLKQDIDDKLFSKLEAAGVVLTKGNEKKVVDVMRRKNDFLNRGADLHIVVVTLRCNLACTYCQASRRAERATEYDMTEETAKKTVDFILQSPTPQLTIEFQGGEPLLNFPIIKFIIEYASNQAEKLDKNVGFSLVSNMVLMDDEKLEYLMKNKVGLCTSLDGPEDVHNKNRSFVDGSDSYSHVKKWVAEIRNKKTKIKGYKSRPNALITVSRHALDKPEEVVDEYVNQGFDKIFLRFMTRLGCASSAWEKIGYTADEFLDFYKKCIDYIVKEKKPIQEQNATMILVKALTEKDPNFLDLRSPCGAVIGQLAYNYNGSVFSCDEGRMVGDIFKIGTVDEKYKDVVTSDESCNLIAASVNDTFICDSCVYKPYCGLCPVCAFANQGNIITKVPTDMRCHIYKGIFDYLFEKYVFDEEYRKVFDEWLDNKGIFLY